MRGLIDKQPTAIAEFVARSHLDGAVAIFGNTELPGTTLRVDTLIETSQRRFQIEFQHRANAREFEPDSSRIGLDSMTSPNLSPGTIEDILERTNMTVLFTDLPLGKELLRRGRKLGLEQGLEQGREQALDVVLALAEQRFGSLPDQTAAAIRHSKLSLKELTNLIVGAPSVSELQTLLGF